MTAPVSLIGLAISHYRILENWDWRMGVVMRRVVLARLQRLARAASALNHRNIWNDRRVDPRRETKRLQE
jgi:hypothetical protein